MERADERGQQYDGESTMPNSSMFNHHSMSSYVDGEQIKAIADTEEGFGAW